MSDVPDTGPAPGAAQPRRRLLRYAVLSTGAVLLVAVLAAGWILTDNERLRRFTEAYLTDLSGRPFVVAGDFSIRFGPVVSLRATDVSWANADWSDTSAMLTIDSLEFAVDTRRLLAFEARIVNIAASGTEVLLEWNAENFNWQFPGASDSEAPPEALPVFLERAELRDTRVRLRHPGLANELVVEIGNLQHREDAAHRLNLDVTAVIDGKPLQVTGQIGPFAELIVGGAIDFDLIAQGDLARLKTSGTFSRLATLERPDLSAELSSEQSGDWLRAFQLPATIAGPTKLQLVIDSADQGLRAGLRGNAGSHTVDARLLVPDRASLDGFELRVDADGPNLGALASLAGYAGLPAAPYRLDIRAQQTLQGLELETFTLDTDGLQVTASGVAGQLPELRDIELNLTASGANLAFTSNMLDLDAPVQQPFRLNATVQSNGRGANDTLQAELTVGSNSARLSAELTEAADFAGSRFKLAANAPQVGELAMLADLELPPGTAATLTTEGSVSEDAIRLKPLELTLRKDRFSGDATIGRKAGLPAVAVQGTARGDNLAALLALFAGSDQAAAVPPDPYELSTALAVTPDAVQLAPAELRLPGGTLRFDGDINLTASGTTVDGALAGRGDDLGKLLRTVDPALMQGTDFTLATRLRVTAERIDLRSIELRTPRATLSGDVGLQGTDFATVSFNIVTAGEDFAAFLPANDYYRPTQVPFRITGKGEFADARIRLDTLAGTLGNIELSGSGELQAAPALAARNVRLRAAGEHLSDIGTVRDWQPEDLPFELHASLAGGGDKVSADDLLVRVGDSELRGKVRYRQAERPFIGLKLESRTFDLDALGIAAAEEPPADNKSGKKLFNDEPLPLDSIRKFDAELDLRIGRLRSAGKDITNVLAQATLQNGTLRVDNIAGELRRGNFRGHGVLQPDPAGWALQGGLTADQVVLPFANLNDALTDLLPRNAVDLQFTTRGTTTRELAANANGFAWVVGGPGQVPGGAARALTGDFLTELLRVVNPFAQERKFLQEECLGAFMEIENGTLQSSPAIVIQNDSLIIAATGTINLVSEKIDLTFETTPRKGVGISISDIINPFTKVVGTLSKPRITLDPTGSMLEGGAAVATGGMTIFAKSLWKRWLGPKEACAKFAEQAIKERRRRDPDNVPDLQAMWLSTQPAGS